MEPPKYDPKQIDRYTVDDVVDFIKLGQLNVHPLRPKDQPSRKGVYWKLFHAIYDNQMEVVKYFYFCPTCKNLLYVDTKILGTNPLARHPCYKDIEMSSKHIEKPRVQKVCLEQLPIKTEIVEYTIPPAPVAKQFPQVAMAPDKISMEQLRILKDAFIGYGDICNRFGPLAPDEIGVIIPNEWSSASW